MTCNAIKTVSWSYLPAFFSFASSNSNSNPIISLFSLFHNMIVNDSCFSFMSTCIFIIDCQTKSRNTMFRFISYLFKKITSENVYKYMFCIYSTYMYVYSSCSIIVWWMPSLIDQQGPHIRSMNEFNGWKNWYQF